MAKATNGRGTMTHGGWRSAAAILGPVAALALGGCASISGGSGTTAAAPASTPAASDGSFTSRVTSLFSGSSSSLAAAPGTPAASATPAATNINCPSVDYREGAATLSVNAAAAPGENAALNLRYQGNFVQTARECAVRNGQLTIKVGVQGRVVVGPAGGPGQITLPLRYALVREGLEPKTLWTKLYTVPVTVPDNQLNVPFIHIEEDMAVPMPPAVELDACVIYVGFDPEGAAAPSPKPPPKAKPKPRTAAQVQ
jgi:hypothetical protein